MDTKEHEIIIRSLYKVHTWKSENMVAFLKETLSDVLAALARLVRMDGFCMEEELPVLLAIKEALFFTVQQRVRGYDAADISDIFTPERWQYYRIVSWPKQDAETSIACEWAVDWLKEIKRKLEVEIPDSEDSYGSIKDQKRFYVLTKVCRNLIDNGSDHIRKDIYFAAHPLASVLYNECFFPEAAEAFSVALRALEYGPNKWILQQRKRLTAVEMALKVAKRPL